MPNCLLCSQSLSGFGQTAQTLRGRIVIRLSESAKSGFFESGKNSRQSQSQIIKSYRPAISWSASGTSFRTNPHPLSDIYFIDLHSGINEQEVIDSLNQLPDVEYAEPYFLLRPLNDINDPLAADQEHLELIRAREAWQIEKGDSTVIIGILDSGINPEHPDLENSILINNADPVNGADDDGDGLIDNYRGWDIADSDNNVLDDTDSHGSWVSGVSNAATNNSIGVAGTGFASSVLPIKIFKSNTNAFKNGYEAIALAADLGCDIINLSWGSEGSYSRFGQDVIDYAVLEKDVAIVAAAGNTDGNLDFYPASFKHVLSVASTDFNDRKASWATYSRHVDLTAPGTAILTTDGSSGYVRKSGSSLSAPQAAGALALIRSRFPELNAIQAMERLRVYSDNIDGSPGNEPYAQLLGKGRLNMVRALTGIGSPALRISEMKWNNGFNDSAYRGDSISLDIEFTNYLHPAGEIAVTVKSESPYVELLTDQFTIDRLESMQSKWMENPVRFVLNEDTPANEDLKFTFEFKSGSYRDYQHIEIRTASDRIDMQAGKLSLSVSGNGNLAFAKDQFQDGIGLTWKNELILKNAALLLAAGDRVADNLPENLLVPYRDNDFRNERSIKLYGNSIADQYASSIFEPQNGLPLHIEQDAIAWNTNDAIILKYRITNTGTYPIGDLHAGLFADFELNDPSKNRITWIDSLKLSITTGNSGTAAGIAVLAGPNIYSNALDKRNANGNTSDLPSLLGDSVKITLLNAAQIDEAGQSGEGNDVASLVSSRPGRLEPGESMTFTCVIAAADSKQDLISNTSTAARQYLETSYFCPGTLPVIDPPGGLYDFYLEPDASERFARTEQLTRPGLDTLNTIYVKEVLGNERYSDLYRINIRPSLVNADFEISPDTLILDERNDTMVRFTDRSNKAVIWDWRFSNGYSSDRPNPKIHFTEEGSYDIRLQVTNMEGCTEIANKSLSVIERSPQPESQIMEGCGPLSLLIEEEAGTMYNLYSDQEGSKLIGSYYRLEFENIRKDSLVYFSSNVDGKPESLISRVEFNILSQDAVFTWQRDTANLNTATLLHFSDVTGSGETNWYVETGTETTWLGNGNSVSFDYSGLQEFSVKLEKTSVYGCTSDSSITFSPYQRPKPEDFSNIICKGDDLWISFENSFYHFYTEGGELIAKGSGFLVQQVEKDTSFYFRDAGGLLESQAAKISIRVTQPNVYFEVPYEPFNIANGLPLILEPLGDKAEQYSWEINN
ncbi:MAG: S8 family serine peptidase, partial [Cyclobacteriaceae bacterium]